VDRAGRVPLLVVWERRDGFDAEDEAPVAFTTDWASAAARAVDALGAPVPAEVRDGRLEMAISLTPVFVEAVSAG
jgi:hypothetical protein